MKWWEMVTLVSAVLAVVLAGATLWLEARREVIETRSHPWSLPTLMNVRPLDSEANFTLAGRPDDDLVYLLGEIVNWGTGLMHHVSAQGRLCEIYVVDNNAVKPFNSVYQIPSSGRMPVVVCLEERHCDDAWVVISWNTLNHQAGSHISWSPVVLSEGDAMTSVAKSFLESMKQPRLSKLWRVVPDRWRPRTLVGPGGFHALYVSRRLAIKCFDAGKELEERYAPLQANDVQEDVTADEVPPPQGADGH